MIYRKWSLFSATVVIWGGIASIGLAQFFLFGGKHRSSWMNFEFEENTLAFLNLVLLLQEKFKAYICHEGERLRQQDRAMMALEKRGA